MRYRTHFLFEAAAVSGAALFHLWQSRVAGATPPVLSLGLSLCSSWHTFACMLILIQTLAGPNKAPAPNRCPRFPLGGSGGFGYGCCAPPASPAAVGEAQLHPRQAD